MPTPEAPEAPEAPEPGNTEVLPQQAPARNGDRADGNRDARRGALGRTRRAAALAVASLAVVSGALLAVPSTVFADNGARTAVASTAQLVAPSHAGGKGYASATRKDAEFNRLFEHRFATVDGMRMHYVTCGTGPVMVLLHGWPQTWYEFRPVMPELAKNRTLIVVDLPGLGDSRGGPTSYDKKTLAQTVHRLVADQLGHRSIDLVAHDIGAGVAFQYAAQHPSEVRHLVHMDYPLPGPGTPAAGPLSLSWHFGFNGAEDGLAQQLVAGREEIYLRHIYNMFGGRPDPIPPHAVNKFVRTYSQSDKLSAGFELYRTLPQDQQDNNATRGRQAAHNASSRARRQQLRRVSD